jgi:FkbM family methyltransferase
MSLSNLLRAYLAQHPQVRDRVGPLLRVRHQLFNRTSQLDSALRELLGNVVSGTLVVKVRDLPGEYELDIRSHILHLILLTKVYEPEITAQLRQHMPAERDVIDVGANAGLFTVLLAGLLSPGRRLLAVEPTPNAQQLLRSNIRRNGCEQSVVVFEGVASDQEGVAEIVTIPGKEEYSSLRGIVHGAAIGDAQPTTMAVRSARLDDLVREHRLSPGLIKIDTEGAEYLVLGGAREILGNHRPIIITELDDALLKPFGHTSGQVVELLQERRYRVLNVRDMAPITTFPFSGNAIALPE